MNETVLTTLGIVVGVALLYAGSRLRSRSARRQRPPPPSPPPSSPSE